MKTYELEFPLKHPKLCGAWWGLFQGREKTLAHNYPVRAFFRRIERAFLILKYKGKGIFKASKKKAKRKNKIEK